MYVAGTDCRSHQITSSAKAKDPWMGLFADEPELVDEILEEALRNRAAQSFNQTIGQGTA
jgi:hypothetical protein